MKIAYDGKRAIRNNTGLGNYSRLVIETMSEAYADADHLVYTPDLRPNPRLGTLLHRSNVAFRLPDRYWALPKAAWRSWGMTAQIIKDGADVFHGLSNELPLNIHLTAVASAVTIHDVIYRRMPECYPAVDRRLYDFKYGFAARHADRVIAVSEATRRDVMEFYGVPEERIDVIYQGCSPIFMRSAPLTERRTLRERYRLPARFLLQVGTIERRKNLELGIKALTALPDDVHLVAVGAGKSYLRHILGLSAELGVRKRLHVLRNVPFSDLPGLYQMAVAALYPSRYEGFGIPVLEALACGTPTVTSDISSLPEAGGDAAFLISPDDPRAMAAAVEAVLADGPEIDRRRARGKIHAASFAADNIASQINSSYLRAIEEHKKRRSHNR